MSAELNVGKLNDLYVNEKKKRKKSLKFVSKSSYKKIFYIEFNLGFFKRSKDRCDFCTMYNNSPNKEEMKTEYERHYRMKFQEAIKGK